MLSPRPSRISDERGFTLIETLVAIITGVVVTGALFTILEVSVRQAAHLTERTQATQLARATMTHIVDELHSSCFATKVTPVQKTATESKLVFNNAYGEQAAVLTPATSAERTIEYEPTKHQLIEFVNKGSSGSYPTFKYESTLVKTVIGEHIYPAKPKGTAIPIFSYDEYNSTSTSGTESAVNSLTPVSVGSESEALGAKKAGAVAAVVVAFAVSPQSGVSSTNRNAEVSSQVTFAFSVPNAETPIKAGPCE
jgi:type II secretory pathway pseudopilin PulG